MKLFVIFNKYWYVTENISDYYNFRSQFNKYSSATTDVYEFSWCMRRTYQLEEFKLISKERTFPTQAFVKQSMQRMCVIVLSPSCILLHSGNDKHNLRLSNFSAYSPTKRKSDYNSFRRCRSSEKCGFVSHSFNPFWLSLFFIIVCHIDDALFSWKNSSTFTSHVKSLL